MSEAAWRDTSHWSGWQYEYDGNGNVTGYWRPVALDDARGGRQQEVQGGSDYAFEYVPADKFDATNGVVTDPQAVEYRTGGTSIHQSDNVPMWAKIGAMAPLALGAAHLAAPQLFAGMGAGATAPATMASVPAAGGSGLFGPGGAFAGAGLTATGAPAVTSLGVPAALGGDALLAGSSLSGALGGAGATGGLAAAGIPVTAGAGLGALQSGVAGGFPSSAAASLGVPGAGGGSPSGGSPSSSGGPPSNSGPTPGGSSPAGGGPPTGAPQWMKDNWDLIKYLLPVAMGGLATVAGQDDEATTTQTRGTPEQNAAYNRVLETMMGGLDERVQRDRDRSDQMIGLANRAAGLTANLRQPDPWLRMNDRGMLSFNPFRMNRNG